MASDLRLGQCHELVRGSRLSGLVGKAEDATALASVWDETLRTGRVFAPGNSATKMEFDQTDGVLLPPNNVFGQGPTVLHIVNLNTAVGGPYWIDLMTYGGTTNYFPVGRVHGWMGYTTNTPAERAAVESWLATFGSHAN